MLAAAVTVGAGLTACGGGGGAGGASGSLPKDAVAQVGTTPITKSSLQHWLAIAGHSTTDTAAAKPAFRRPLPEPPDYKACIAALEQAEPSPATAKSQTNKEQLKKQCQKQYKEDLKVALGFLITTQWLIGEAHELGFEMSDKEAEKVLAKLKKQRYKSESEFKKYLSQTGYTVPDLLLKVKYEELPERIEKKIVSKAEKSITDAKVKKYYEDHKSQFHETDRRGANILLVPTKAAAEAAKAEIEGGKSFASVAKRVSILHTSQKGGTYITAARGKESKDLEQALFKAKKGVLTGPVKTASGYYVFEVDKVLPEEERPFVKVAGDIQTHLQSSKAQSAMTTFPKTFAKKWTSRTDCKAGYVVPDCKQYKPPASSKSKTKK